MGAKAHPPLTKVVLAAILTYLLALWLHPRPDGWMTLSFLSLLALAAGALYTHLFEYAYHRVAMHMSFRFRGRHYYDKRHLRHHQLFLPESFRTREPLRLAEVATRFYTFPILFWPHYLAFCVLLPAGIAPWFFLGVTAQFLAYEVSHWFIHVEDNGFDRVIGRVPLLGQLRAAQVEHHRRHHAAPAVNFNFTPPYLGDRLGRTATK